MRASGDNRVSGVVTKWMPLFNVQVRPVGCCGMGTLRPLTPSTENNGIRMCAWRQHLALASNKDFTMCLAWFLLGSILLNLLSILILHLLVSSAEKTILKRTVSEGRLTAFQAIPLCTSPANDVCETCSASAEAKIASCSRTRYFCHSRRVSGIVCCICRKSLTPGRCSGSSRRNSFDMLLAKNSSSSSEIPISKSKSLFVSAPVSPVLRLRRRLGRPLLGGIDVGRGGV